MVSKALQTHCRVDELYDLSQDEEMDLSVLTLTEGDNHSFLLQSPMHNKARFSTILRAESIPVSGTGGDPFLDIRKMNSVKKITRKSVKGDVSLQDLRFESQTYCCFCSC